MKIQWVSPGVQLQRQKKKKSHLDLISLEFPVPGSRKCLLKSSSMRSVAWSGCSLLSTSPSFPPSTVDIRKLNITLDILILAFWDSCVTQSYQWDVSKVAEGNPGRFCFPSLKGDQLVFIAFWPASFTFPWLPGQGPQCWPSFCPRSSDKMSWAESLMTCFQIKG